MQVNRVGIGLIAFFALAGLGLAVVALLVGASGQVAWILALLGGIWFLVAAGLALFARRQRAKAAHQDWVFQNGIRGTATVLEASSHATVNEMPVMKLQLDVPGIAPARLGAARSCRSSPPAGWSRACSCPST
jgi:hypothetical protein